MQVSTQCNTVRVQRRRLQLCAYVKQFSIQWPLRRVIDNIQ